MVLAPTGPTVPAIRVVSPRATAATSPLERPRRQRSSRPDRSAPSVATVRGPDQDLEATQDLEAGQDLEADVVGARVAMVRTRSATRPPARSESTAGRSRPNGLNDQSSIPEAAHAASAEPNGKRTRRLARHRVRSRRGARRRDLEGDVRLPGGHGQVRRPCAAGVDRTRPCWSSWRFQLECALRGGSRRLAIARSSR